MPPESQVEPSKASQHDNENNDKDDQPLLIVDLTQLDDSVHCRFDAHSVNDAAAASAWRRQLEANYQDYAKDASDVP